jgi:3-isopropylmalate/(R)-2-methylmalate dehydratase small subunit
LPITIEEKIVEKLKHISGELEVDLENQILKTNTEQISFEIDSHKKKILLEGLDDISQTLQFEDKISEFEKQSKIPSVL